MQTSRSDRVWPTGKFADWRQAKFTDLKGWQNYYRMLPPNPADEYPIAAQPQSPGADVLLALSRYDSAIEELPEASQRPYSRFADYQLYDPKANALLDEYLQELKSCFSVIQLRALAELSEGHTAKAFDDVNLLLRLNDLLRQELILMPHLVSSSTMILIIQPIYEGLARHQWSDAQLAELDEKIGDSDFLADYHKVMRGECALSISLSESLSGSEWFIYRNELAVAQMYEEKCLPLVNLTKRLVSPELVAQTKIAEEKHHFNPFTILAQMTFLSVSTSAETFARTQTYADLTEVACALERYRMARGNYPETLDALEPQFIHLLPHDVINGQPLHYHRTEDGKFVLYSVGWDDKDDGGKVILTKAGTIDREKGDWVWHYPAE